MDGENIIKGEFRYDTDTGKLEFVCHEQNRAFEQVKEAIIAMRDELERQIYNQYSCPYYRKTEEIEAQCKAGRFVEPENYGENIGLIPKE